MTSQEEIELIQKVINGLDLKKWCIEKANGNMAKAMSFHKWLTTDPAKPTKRA